ncbi:DUF1750-domain-containing protein [Sporormia fimetaria CBS 119925]|uniref:DUF1750-domain-containing protein n=1 Tax=Sporormia fimetaria CBS 119925 TaxID=1340428 RepID=A0A6A6VB56_9PLEO|nr:DUF1750-domain-containing protein [Sporormia fimetaria CBS 119925]
MYPMAQNFNPSDPSYLVSPPLLQHVHLISSYRFPSHPHLLPEQALDLLIKGPTIVKESSSVAWTYFPTPPPHGSVHLEWQPPRMQTNYASDGLVWADPEGVYDMPVRGYNLQILVQKSGFQYPNEPFSTHARFRYRITQGPGHVDPQLWIVHYAAAEPQDCIPSSQISIPREVHAMMQMRSQLEATGQLIRKEFVLADRSKWPKVEFTPRTGAQQPAFYNPMQPGRAYNQPPPNKRQRSVVQRPPNSAGIIPEHSLEDEENATQDSFDFITPREISQSRYKQHHEWMEEIFSSPYAVGQILPIDLGLGLMGELAPLTAGLLDAPSGEVPSRERPGHKSKYEVKNYSKLTPEQLKDFESRVAAYTKRTEAELETMKAAHAKKMSDIKRSRTYTKAERRLRDLARQVPARSTDESGEPDGEDALNSVVKDLEATVGAKFETQKNVVCVQKGGLIEEQEQEAAAQQAQQHISTAATRSIAGDTPNMLMDDLTNENNAASLLDQFGTSLAGTPISLPVVSQQQSRSQSAVPTPSAPAAETKPAGQPSGQGDAGITDGPDQTFDLDVEMSGMANTEQKGEGDWVVVDQSANPQQAGNSEQLASGAPNATVEATTVTGAEQEVSTGLFDAEFESFDNLVDDSAGDALADYTNVDDNMGLDLDDSAFGDAFHGTEMHQENTEGDNM